MLIESNGKLNQQFKYALYIIGIYIIIRIYIKLDWTDEIIQVEEEMNKELVNEIKYTITNIEKKINLPKINLLGL